MRVAHVLSDLTSLRACEPSAARALVCASQVPLSSQASQTNLQAGAGTSKPAAAGYDANAHASSRTNPDLERAYQLQLLHQTVKLAYSQPPQSSTIGGGNAGNATAALAQSRSSVRDAAASLGLSEEISSESPKKLDSSSEYAISQSDNTGNEDVEDDDEELSAWS